MPKDIKSIRPLTESTPLSDMRAVVQRVYFAEYIRCNVNEESEI